MAVIKNVSFTKMENKTSVGEDVVKLELSDTAGGNVKWFSFCGK